MAVLGVMHPALCALALLQGETSSAREYSLAERESMNQAFRVNANVEIEGTFQTPSPGGAETHLDVRSHVVFEYDERRMSGIGRDAEAWRSLRYYNRATAHATIGGRRSERTLNDGLRLLVVQGRQQGIEFHSPARRMTRTDLDLLAMPGDTLPAAALLPSESVSVGESWQPSAWIAPMLTGVEAVLKHDLNCTLAEVTDGIARVQILGSVDGVSLGAEMRVKISGQYLFDTSRGFMTRLALTQAENRSIGTVNPGMKVTAKVRWQRSPLTTSRLPDPAIAARLPLDPEPRLLQLSMELPWQARFEHGREWHLFHRTQSMSILRLVENGALLAQCNVSEVAPVAAGAHTDVRQFKADIRSVLGERFEAFDSAADIDTQSSLYVHRVVARGNSGDRAMNWLYYLCAAPDGRQVAFVFAVEDADIKRLRGRDEAIVRSTEFLQTSRVSRTQ